MSSLLLKKNIALYVYHDVIRANISVSLPGSPGNFSVVKPAVFLDWFSLPFSAEIMIFSCPMRVL